MERTIMAILVGAGLFLIIFGLGYFYYKYEDAALKLQKLKDKMEEHGWKDEDIIWDDDGDVTILI